LGRNVKLIRNFISLFFTFFLGNWPYWGNWRPFWWAWAHMFWVRGMKDLFFVDGRNFENIFAGV